MTAPLATASANPAGVAAPTQQAAVVPAAGMLRNARTITVPAFRFLVAVGDRVGVRSAPLPPSASHWRRTGSISVRSCWSA